MSAQIRSSRRRLDGLGATSRRRFVLGLSMGLLPAGILFSRPRSARAANRPLDEARAAGIVGERYDGYAVLRDSNAPADVRDLVASINGQRKQLYERRAASEGVSVAQVGRVYAQEIFNAAPRGTWFLQESGAWVQR